MTDESKLVADEQVENQALPTEAEVAEANAAEEVRKKEEGAPIPRHLVTKIVERERLDARQKAKKEFMADLEAQRAAELQAQQMNPPTQAQPQTVGLGGMESINPEKIHQMIAEAAQKLDEKRRLEAEQQHHYDHAQKIAHSFNSQMANGKLKRPDFDEKMKHIDFKAMSPLVHLAAETGIADEVMIDLVDHPQKITHLMSLAQTQPYLAKLEMEKLAASIKQNQEAKSFKSNTRDPLDQITPSTVGTDNGEMSVRDFQEMFSR